MATSVGREASKKNQSLRDFGGVNTQAARQVIGDNQFAWLENVHPIGFGNMPAVPGPSASLASWTGTAYHMQAVNIGGVDYELVLTTSGALYAVNLSSFAVATVGAAGTFSGSGTTLCQWENAQAIIVDPTKGYFSWDGSTLTKWNGTLQSLSITAIGTGYTSAPTIGGFSSGGGSGGAATCAIQVGLAAQHAGAAGTGYAVGDVLTMSGGTFTTAAQVRVTAVNGSGGITGFTLTALGVYTVAPGNPVSTTGGYGTGAQFDLNFGIGPVTLTAVGSGYTSAPTITVTGGAGSGGAITANLSVVPSGGTAVATYAGRVWVASNRTVVFSAPSSFSDFTSTSAGGSFIVVDETLHSSIQTIVSANNFLYIAGSSSMNVVADVTVVNGATVFSNTNIAANIGTSQPYSVLPYYRALWFCAPYGIYALYGSTTQKASDDLDGVFPYITSTTPISAGTAVLNDINVLCFLFQYADPLLGYTRPLLACFSGKKWFFASQGSGITQVDTAIINGLPTLFATDGTNLYRLFSSAATAVDQTIKTKLWDMGDPLSNKQVLKIGLEVINKVAQLDITGTLDTEIAGDEVAFTFSNNNFVTWINTSGQAVPWENSTGQTVLWVYAGYSFFGQDVQAVGRYIGLTLSGSSAGTVYSGAHLQYEVRTPWPHEGAM